MKLMVTLVVIASLMFLVGCDSPIPKKIKSVHKVYFSKGGYYTIVVAEDDTYCYTSNQIAKEFKEKDKDEVIYMATYKWQEMDTFHKDKDGEFLIQLDGE